MKSLKKTLIGLIIFSTILINGPRVEAKGLVVKRLEGENRIETAISVSRDTFEKSKAAILVGFNGEVDALTGTILAQEKKAPILMTYKNKLDPSLVKELKRLDVREVFIIGGESTVEAVVEEKLKDLAFQVTRIKGNNREETAINISKKAIEGKVDEAFLSLGYGVYADALAIGPIAANKNLPLLLTQRDSIKENTLEYLKEKGIETVTIVGGKNAVSQSVENTLKDLGIKIKRVQGKSREETAINIAKKYIENPEKIIVANGYKYADAVVGGYLGAKENSPILLNNDSALNSKNRVYISEKGISTTVLGGNASIGNTILKDIKIGLGIIKEDIREDIVEDMVQEDRVEVEEDLPEIGFAPSSTSIPSNPAELKNSMKKELEAFKAQINISYEGIISSEAVREIIRDIYTDGSYIGGAIKTITPRVNKLGDSSEIILSAQYYNTKKEEAFIDSQVKKIIKDIIKPGMSDFQKVKAVNDYIVNNTSYSTETEKTPHSAYAALVENKAVCQGYALLTYRFLDALDIENYYLIGDSLGSNGWGLHAWNLVRLDGKYYHLDTTKNDPLVVDGNHILSYRYFLLSDKKIGETHRVQRDIFPQATDSKYEVLSNAYNPYEYKNQLYFGNLNDGEKLYKISLDNLKLTKLSDTRTPYLAVHGDRIYFSNFSSGGHIYSSDLAGKNIKQENKVYSTHLQLENNNIKFFNRSTEKWDSLKI